MDNFMDNFIYNFMDNFIYNFMDNFIYKFMDNFMGPFSGIIELDIFVVIFTSLFRVRKNNRMAAFF